MIEEKLKKNACLIEYLCLFCRVVDLRLFQLFLFTYVLSSFSFFLPNLVTYILLLYVNFIQSILFYTLSSFANSLCFPLSPFLKVFHLLTFLNFSHSLKFLINTLSHPPLTFVITNTSSISFTFIMHSFIIISYICTYSSHMHSLYSHTHIHTFTPLILPHNRRSSVSR